MPEIKLKTRIQNKYKILEEWNQLVKGDFIPLKGEVCYGIDEDTLYQKIGDGETDFVELPWLLNQSDWLENDKTSPSYVQNRIAYIEVAEGDPILEIKYVNNDGISNPMVIQNNVAIACEGRKFAEEDIGKLWSFNLKCTNTDGTNPLEIDVPGPAELNSFEIDGDIIYYYGNFYRFMVLYLIMDYQDDIAAGDITIEDIEQAVRDEFQIEDTNENYAFVNMYGTIIGAMFGVTPDDPNNFNYEFSLSSYPTIVHKLNSKYLEEVNLVGKFEDIDDFSEIFNDYANNKASAPYSHAEGRNSSVSMGTNPSGAGGGGHAEGYQTRADGNAGHAEGYQTEASGTGSHAEGYNTSTHGSRYGEHAEGYYTHANGYGAHAEGMKTIASYFESEGSAHAEGYGSIARGNSAHAEGGNELVASQWNKFINNSYVEYKISNATCSIVSKNQINTVGLPPNYRTGIIEVYSDEAQFKIYPDGTLYNSLLSDELVASGTLHNVFYHIRQENVGAAGDYSHVEGKNNTATGDCSHVEGEDNTEAGANNHVSGSNNIVSGQNNFIHGQHLVANYNNQVIFGGYNEPDEDAVFVIGNNLYNGNNRKNNLSLKRNGDLWVKGNVYDGEEDTNTMWKQVGLKESSSYDKTFHIFNEEDIEFIQSNMVKPNLLKIGYSSSGSSPSIYYRNGNIFDISKISNQTLDTGSTLTVDKENNSFIINAKASDTIQTFTFLQMFADADEYVHRYYCWDELADSEIYYGLDDTTNVGNNLIYHYNNVLNDVIALNIYIKPGVEKEIVLPFPVLTTCVAPKKWVPPMEKILIPKDSKYVEVDISQYPFNGQVSLESPARGTWSGYAYAIPKTVINENRMQFILDDLKEEISTSLILKSPNGTKFNITVNDDGTLSTTQI